MFEKCIKCNRMGESCVPNLMLLPFSNLMQWCDKRQKYLEWTTQTLAEKSNVPIGTIKRIKAGEYHDCKYSTIKSILIALIGGTTDEFSCTEMVEKELQQKEQFEQQATRIAVVEAENEMLKEQLRHIDDLHRQDIRAIKTEYEAQKAEYQERIDFLKDELKARRSWHQ